MKNTIVKSAFILLALISYSKSNAQIAGKEPITIEIKGDWIGTYEDVLNDGSTETIIACACSESTCYTITADYTGDIIASQSPVLNYSGNGIEKMIPQGTKIEIDVQGVKIKGRLKLFNSNMLDGNLLQREHHYIIDQD